MIPWSSFSAVVLTVTKAFSSNPPNFCLWKVSFLPNLPLSTLTACSLKESEQSTGAVVYWSGKLLQWSAVGCSAPRRVLTLTFPIAFLGLAWTVETLQCAQPRPAHSTTGCCCKGIVPAISHRCSVISHPVQDASSLFRNTVGNSFVPNQLILSIFAPMLASQATASGGFKISGFCAIIKPKCG